MLQKLAHATNHMTFRLVRDWVQSSLRNGVHDDPWLPHGANDQMMVWVDAFLKELNVRMDNEEDEITSVEFKKEMRELININNWPPPPPLWRNPLWWARCRILYALSPADRNSTYSSTVTVGRWMSLLYLLLWMPFGISGPAWLAAANVRMSTYARSKAFFTNMMRCTDRSGCVCCGRNPSAI